MARADVPVVLTSTGTLQETDIGVATSKVMLRARSSNVQAISCNLTLPAEPDPSGTGGNAFVLFPGESVTLDSIVADLTSLQVKRITLNDETDLADPVLELIKITP